MELGTIKKRIISGGECDMKIIDKGNWDRLAHFNVHSQRDVPIYGITVDVDVTNLKKVTKEKDISFYYALVYLVTESLDSVENFRYKIQGEEVVLYDRLIPSFTDMGKGESLYKGVTLEKGEDLVEFCRRAKKMSTEQIEYFPDIEFPLDQLIHFSMVPWLNFTAFKNQFYIDKNDSIPKVTMGKYVEKEGRLQLPLSIEVNHRLVDGYHLGLFYDTLAKKIAEL